MKNITLEEGYLAFEKLFKSCLKGVVTVVIWQLKATGEREIHQGFLTSYQFEKRTLSWRQTDDEPHGFSAAAGIYAYVPSAEVIFKTQALKCELPTLTLQLPTEITFLTTAETSSLPQVRTLRDQAIFNEQLAGLSLADEDRLYADKREAPRSRPQVDKWMRCQSLGQPDTSAQYLLLDLSRGGLGVRAPLASTFVRGQWLEITALGEDLFDRALKAEVMSVRDLSPGEEGYKVGVRFIDE